MRGLTGPAPWTDDYAARHKVHCQQRLDSPPVSHFLSSTQAPSAEPSATTPRRIRRWLLAAVAVIIVLMYLVPYTLLSDINAWYGSFLFWTLTTLAVLIINAVLAFGWED